MVACGADGRPVLGGCPTQGAGAIVAPGRCLVFTPIEAGASSLGDNANETEYALEPVAPSRGALVVHFNGSFGSPAGQIADPQLNFYNAAAQAGFHVLALAYRSNMVIGIQCSNNASCFGPTRKTIVLGTYEPGAATSLTNMRADESIVERLDAALRLLVAAQPGSGWDQFLADRLASTAAQRVAWGKVIATGHSQGGGHAAYLAQLFPLRWVVQLSSTCDAVGATPAPWTSASATWATSPATSLVGFAAPTVFTNGIPTGGDTTCPRHLAVWQSMGLDPSRQHDDAAVCNATGDTHSASIGCTANFAAWGTLFQ